MNLIRKIKLSGGTKPAMVKFGSQNKVRLIGRIKEVVKSV